jgi:hypothetical protein
MPSVMLPAYVTLCDCCSVLTCSSAHTTCEVASLGDSLSALPQCRTGCCQNIVVFPSASTFAGVASYHSSCLAVIPQSTGCCIANEMVTMPANQFSIPTAA